MKKMKYALHSVAALAVAALAAACSSDNGAEVKPTGAKQTMTLTAYQPGSESETRVGFGSNGNAYWQTGDAIGVWSVGDSKFNSFGLSKGEGTATATFSGTVTDEAGQYAVYPYDENHSLNGTTLTYNLPHSYTYTSVDQTLFPEGKNGNSFRMPMYGVISDNKVQFKHLGGVVCLIVDEMPAASGTVTVAEYAHQLCGAFTSDLSAETPQIGTDWSKNKNDTVVTFTFSGATKGAMGVFYLPVAVGDYNLTVYVTGDDGEVHKKTVGLEMKRAVLKKVNIILSSKDKSQVINDHQFVDLGLPSGLLWAETNIGATTAADEGDYYAWGETETKTTYSLSTYKYYDTSSSSISKYNSSDNMTTLETSDDAAYVNWGTSCRVPTAENFEELSNSNNCEWTWTSRTKSDGSTTIYGYEVKSKTNNNSIFLPAAGYYSDNGLAAQGSYGLYWSKYTDDKDIAVSLSYDSTNHYVNSTYMYRYYGMTIRPVANPQNF